METRLRSTPEQFNILVTFMERNGDLAWPQNGPLGRRKSNRLWKELTELLNSSRGGVIKSTDKWKKVWADWKTKTKSKAILQIKHSETGGDPNMRHALTALEERVMAVMEARQSYVAPQPSYIEASPPPSFDATSPPSYNVASRPSFDEASPPAYNAASPPTYNAASPPKYNAASPPTYNAASPPSYSAASPPLPNAGNAASPPPSARTAPQRHRRRPVDRGRRHLQMTPCERACAEFAAIEMRRLRSEEARERLHHERETERLRLEELRIESHREQRDLLKRLISLAEILVVKAEK